MAIDLHISEDSQRGKTIRRLASQSHLTPEQVLDRIIDDGLRSQIDPDNFDHIFTPEVLSELDKASAEAKAGGKTYSMEEVREHFEEKRKVWLANHPG